jgi:transcriptional regulator with XRE-family HTH domain
MTSPSDAPPALPVRKVTVNQIVAWNIAWYRREADLKQRELAGRLGWPQHRVSEAERSWDGDRTREFDAQLLTELAAALGVPLLALFLPPADDGAGQHYTLRFAGEEGRVRDMTDLMVIVTTDSDDDSPVMNAYRDRLRAASDFYLRPEWAQEVRRWLAPHDEKQARADRVSKLRSRRLELLDLAGELEDLADALDEDGDQ